MKKFIVSIALIYSRPVGADPCRSLLEVAHALDLRTLTSTSHLRRDGHLELETPLRLAIEDFNRLALEERVGSAVFERAREWTLERSRLLGRGEDEIVSPDLKHLALYLGQSLESYLRFHLHDEHLDLDRLVIHWDSSEGFSISSIAPRQTETRPVPFKGYLHAMLTLTDSATVRDPRTAGRIRIGTGKERVRRLARDGFAPPPAATFERGTGRLTLEFHFSPRRHR